MCTHNLNDSVTVCKDCGIDLKAVNALQNCGIENWKGVKEAYASGELFAIGGIGRKTALRLMDMEFTH